MAALKGDEPYSDACTRLLERVPHLFQLVEPGIVYQEVCGTLARHVGLEVAKAAEKSLNRFIHPRLLFNCDQAFCASAYPLCYEYGIYATDALYLKAALSADAVLISLDKQDFIGRVKAKRPDIKAHHISEIS